LTDLSKAGQPHAVRSALQPVLEPLMVWLSSAADSKP
jgi:hypothetical protein